LAATVVDLGANSASRVLALTNPGQLPVDWSITDSPAPFSLVNASGTLQPGQQHLVTVALDRANLAEGTYERTVTVTDANGGNQKVLLRARVERAPQLVLDGPESTLSACEPGPPPVYVGYNDESDIAFPATISWNGPEKGSTQLKQRADIAVYGNVVISGTLAGTYTYTVFVTDVRGNIATIGGSFEIQPCPG